MRSRVNPPGRHHYVPEFYSKFWAGDDGRFERYTRPYSNKIDIKRVYPSQVGWVDGLYCPIEGRQSDIIALESSFFSPLDNKAAKVLAKLNAPIVETLSGEERSAWTLFIMSMYHRTPENLSAIKDMHARVLIQIKPKFENDIRKEIGEHAVQEFREHYEKFDKRQVDKSTLEILPYLIDSKNIGKAIFDMEWVTLDCKTSDNNFLLSDDFIIRTDGIKIQGGHMAMPISPARLLICANNKETANQICEMPINSIVAEVNKSTVESARHFVVSTNRLQSRFIENRFGRNPKPGLGRNAPIEFS